MTNRIYAVIALCHGDENFVNISAVKTVLPDACHITVAGPKDLSKAVVNMIKNGNISCTVENTEETPEELAIAYIGEKFQKYLTGPERNLMDFVSELSTAITIAKWQHNDIRLENAIDILRSKQELVIKKDIRKKYNITDTVLKEILKIANKYV